MQVFLNSYSLNIDRRGTQILVFKGILSSGERAGFFSDDASKRMSGLMQMNVLNSCGGRIPLKVVHKSM